MLDSQSILDVPLVHTIRELIRSWWRLELGFTDASGYVLTHADGVAVPPPNDFCRLSLASPEGFKACNRSVTDAVRLLEENTNSGARLVSPCHMGFPQAMAPISRNGRLFGTVFTAGFVIEGHEEPIRHSLDAGAQRLGLFIENRWEAHSEVPVLSERDLEVSDLRNSLLKLDPMIDTGSARARIPSIIVMTPTTFPSGDVG